MGVWKTPLTQSPSAGKEDWPVEMPLANEAPEDAVESMQTFCSGACITLHDLAVYGP